MESKAEENSVNPYDEVPYESYPYPTSGPDYLRTIGRLFGLDAPDVKTARVLDIGCADGGNIIPHAVKYPDGKFVGLDLSKVQIDIGRENIEKMNLQNIELKHMSIASVDQDFGEFDYIICHGVISWVPDPIRDKILEIFSKHLSPKGIAYVSYNTLPGWNMIRTIRDMMLYHSRQFTDLEEKISQAKIVLSFINEALASSDNPYANMLKSETEKFANYTDDYLRHEYLEEDNRQFYFSEFMDEAHKYNLQYLSECSLFNMYVNNLPNQIAEKLSGINEIVRTEQYMDFITNRRFRQTLLCHGNVRIQRELSKSVIKDFALSSSVKLERPSGDVDLEDRTVMRFYLDEDKKNSISSESPAMKAIMLTLAANRCNPLPFEEVVRQSNEKVKTAEPGEIEEILEENGLMLLLRDFLDISLEPGNFSERNLDRPKLFKVAFYQITQTSKQWVTSLRHERILINYFDRVAGSYMNGENTVPQIVEKLIDDAKNKEFVIEINGRIITEHEELEKYIHTALNQTVQKFSKQALLV